MLVVNNSSVSAADCCFVFRVCFLSAFVYLYFRMWIACPRPNTPRENVETPSTFQTSFLEGSLGEHGRIVMFRSRHGAFSLHTPLTNTPPSEFPAAALWKAPLDCSFDPRAEGALDTARPPRSLALLVLLVPPVLLVASGTSSHLLLSPPLSTGCCIGPHFAVVVQQ